MKGFVMTLVTISIIMILVMLSVSMHNSHLKMERALTEPQPLIYSAFLFDGVAEDVKAIAGPNMAIRQTNESTTIIFGDIVPGDNVSSDLNSYENFLESAIANQSHAQIDANFSNMSTGVLVDINEHYTYERDFAAGEVLFTAGSDTGATYYEINITVVKERANFTSFPFNSSGDLTVNVRYLDMNGSKTEGGKLFSNEVNRMEVLYADGGYLYVDIGKKNGSDGSLWMKAVNASASVQWLVDLPPAASNESIGYEYDASLEYVLGNVRMQRKIGNN